LRWLDYLGIGHGPEWLMAYFLWGGGSALVLFTGKLFARLLAIPWQALMLTYFFLKARAPEDALLPAAWILPAMIYLAVTAILQFRRNRNT